MLSLDRNRSIHQQIIRRYQDKWMKEMSDRVNVASRIGSIAGANEICFSNIVFQNIRNREEIEIENMGNQQLKNVDYPVEVYKIVV